MKSNATFTAICILLLFGAAGVGTHLFGQGPPKPPTDAPCVNTSGGEACTEDEDYKQYCDPDTQAYCTTWGECQKFEDEPLTCSAHDDDSGWPNAYKYRTVIESWPIGSCAEHEYTLQTCTHCSEGDCAYKCARFEIYLFVDSEGSCVTPCDNAFYIPKKGCR